MTSTSSFFFVASARSRDVDRNIKSGDAGFVCVLDCRKAREKAPGCYLHFIERAMHSYEARSCISWTNSRNRNDVDYAVMQRIPEAMKIQLSRAAVR